MCVCHLANRHISSYYSNMPGPAATVNCTVRRYESLIKIDITHSNKGGNSSPNSMHISTHRARYITMNIKHNMVSKRL